jgi:antitoxin MazE
MIVKIQKWGNSLGLRIPKNLAADVHVAVGSTVLITIEDGRIVLSPERNRRIPLKELIAGITPENVHGETNTGAPVGREVW